MLQHKVKKGESLNTISIQRGFFWETVWNDENNSALRELRKNPEVLEAGDEIVFPEITIGNEAVASEAKHSFTRRGIPVILRLCLSIAGKPRAGLAFEIRVGIWTHQGETDNDGKLQVKLPPDSENGILITRGPEGEVVRKLQFGYLDPPESQLGAIDRLINLGYAKIHDRDADMERFEQVLRFFQVEEKLSTTGKLNSDTVERLKERHGS